MKVNMGGNEGELSNRKSFQMIVTHAVFSGIFILLRNGIYSKALRYFHLTLVLSEYEYLILP